MSTTWIFIQLWNLFTRSLLSLLPYYELMSFLVGPMADTLSTNVMKFRHLVYDQSDVCFWKSWASDKISCLSTIMQKQMKRLHLEEYSESRNCLNSFFVNSQSQLQIYMCIKSLPYLYVYLRPMEEFSTRGWESERREQLLKNMELKIGTTWVVVYSSLRLEDNSYTKHKITYCCLLPCFRFQLHFWNSQCNELFVGLKVKE